MNNNIVLSGGWGYGNLGDEAILISSINLIHKLYPHCHIDVLIYRECETVKYLKSLDYVDVKESTYALMYGIKYETFDFGESLLCEVAAPIKRRIKHIIDIIKRKYSNYKLLRNQESYLKQYSNVTKYVEDVFSNADMLIMSGGGYFNKWHKMLVSKLIELDTAKRLEKPVLFIGQTIGPFDSYSLEIARKNLDNVDGIFFRDIESITDVKGIKNLLPEVIPDIALYDSFVQEKEKYIVLVPFRTDLNKYIKPIVCNVQKIFKESHDIVKIVVSQQWPWAMQIAMSFYFELRANKIDAELVIPRDFFHLQKILASSEFVISQNLHGLILAYRGHTPVYSLNTRRKFVSFMHMIGYPNNMNDPSDIDDNCLYSAYMNRHQFSFDKLATFRQQIEDAFRKITKI